MLAAPLASVTSALRCVAPGAEALPHIALAVSVFLDESVRFTLANAAASGSLHLFCRVLSRLQQNVPPIDEFLMESYLSESMITAVEYGHLPIARHIHEIHPGKLHGYLLPLAATFGDIPMVQWLLETRRDERCVPCLHEREAAIEVLEDPPTCCLNSTFVEAVAWNQFGVVKWLVENGYHGSGSYLWGAGVNAARVGDMETIKWLHELNQFDTFSSQAIDEAARAGHTEVVAFLLANRSEGYSWLAHCHATIGGHDEIVELLASPAHQHLLRGTIPTREEYLWEAAKAGRFDLVMGEEPDQSTSMEFPMRYACELGRLDAIERMLANDADAMSKSAVDLAVQNGHLHILQWIHEQGITTPILHASIVDSAAASGHLDIVKWLHHHYSSAFEYGAMNEAASHGHLEIVEWLHLNRTEGCTTSAMDSAARFGHLHVVQWLHANRTEGCTVEAMEDAATNGHHAVVKWLHTNRTEGCTTAAMDSAAKNGDLELVIWLHQHRTEGCTTRAMDKSPLYVVKWLHLNRSEGCTAAAIIGAAESGNLSKIQFLLTHRDEVDVMDAALTAAARGHLYILQWLQHHYPQDMDLELLVNPAQDSGESHIVQWLELYTQRAPAIHPDWPETVCSSEDG